jgi:hypothetical protein
MTTCVPCGLGSYSTGTGASSNTSCLPCDSGMYSDASGASSCTVCKDGTYQSSVGATVCLVCGAGTFRNATNLNGTSVGGAACSPCALDAWSGEGSSACTCNAGYVPDQQGLGSCIDVDECAPGVGISPACASTSSSQTCVNIPGSFYCSGGGKLPAKCGDPLPSSCPVSGGGTIYVSVEGIQELSQASNATVRLDGSAGSSEASAQISGALLSFVCPPSDSVGTVLVTVLRNTADGVPVAACAFFLTYNPPAAFALPLTIPTTGGQITLSLAGYDKLVGNGAECVVRQVH